MTPLDKWAEDREARHRAEIIRTAIAVLAVLLQTATLLVVLLTR